jgi:hypothetical protein
MSGGHELFGSVENFALQSPLEVRTMPPGHGYPALVCLSLVGGSVSFLHQMTAVQARGLAAMVAMAAETLEPRA